MKTFLSIMLFICVSFSVRLYFKPNEYECGTVIDKSSSFHESAKHVVSSHDYLFVKMDNGEYVKHDVTFDTYYKHGINDRICFKISEDAYWLIIGTSGLFFIVFGTAYLIT